MSNQENNTLLYKTSINEDDVKNLFGLTPEVEKEIINSIKADKKKRLTSLFNLLHPSDQADMLERLDKSDLEKCLSWLSKKLDPETLVYLDENVQEYVIKEIGTKAIIKALPELNTDDEVEILENLGQNQRDNIIKKLCNK